MGLDTQIQLVLGIPFWEIADTPEKQNLSRTRYDRKTGEPHEEKYTAWSIKLANGDKLERGSSMGSDDFNIEEYFEKHGLQSSGENPSNGIIGKIIKKGDCVCGAQTNFVAMPNDEEIQKVYYETLEKLKKWGVSDDVINKHFKIYAVLYASY